jgi:hypothetical protein
MTSAATWPPHPARIRHAWRCARRGPIVETVHIDRTGRTRPIEQCAECGETDLVARIRAETEQRPT